MRKWLPVVLVFVLVMAVASMAMAVTPSIKATMERDLDAEEFITEIKFNLKAAPWAFELEYDQNLTAGTDATLAFIAALDVGPINLEWDTPLTSDALGDLTATFGFSPFTLEWEYPLGEDLAGVVSLVYKKSW